MAVWSLAAELPSKACDKSGLLSGFADGTWGVAARPSGASSPEQLALTAFTVDTQAPTIEITSSPGNVSAVSSVSFQFSSNTSDINFSCSLTYQGNGSAGNETGPQPCTSPANYAALADGPYAFSVACSDRVGNRAEPEERAFLVDTQAPVINSIRYPEATRDGDFQVNFVAEDGAEGSGVAFAECRLRPLRLASGDLNDTAAAYQWQNCSSPKVYSDLPQGRWELTLQATDKAGLQQATREMDVWVESEPPETAVVSGPSRNQSVPSTVVFSFASQSESGLGTPISRSICRLVQLSTAVAQQLAAAPSPDTSLPGSSVRPAPSSAAGNLQLSTFSQTVSSLPLWASNSSQAPSAAAGGGVCCQGAPAPGPLDAEHLSAQSSMGWEACTSPVTYTGLNSGNYSFQVKAVDAAGNEGAPTQNYPFSVDAGLKLGGGATAFWGLGWKFWLVVGGGGVAVLAAIALLAFCCARCCRRAGSDAYQAHQNTVGTPRTARATPASRRSSANPTTPAYDPDAIAQALRLSLASHQSTPRGPQAPSAPDFFDSVIALEEQQLRQALARSLVGGPQEGGPSGVSSGTSSPGVLTTQSSDAEDRGLLASHRGERKDAGLHRALMLSLQQASRDAHAPLVDGSQSSDKQTKP